MEGSDGRLAGAPADPEGQDYGVDCDDDRRVAEHEGAEDGNAKGGAIDAEAGAESRAERRTGARRPGVTREGTQAGKDWITWHVAYDEDTPLHHRLHAVQQRIREDLMTRPAGPIRVISACAGEGRDLFGALVDHPRAADVHGRLVELDGELAARAAASAPPGVEVTCADAGSTDAYVGAAPADLVLVCGVFGNVSDGDVERTIRALPAFCAAGATVIWTRHRRPPDLTLDIRRWFAARRVRAGHLRCARGIRVERRGPPLRGRARAARSGSSVVRFRA